MQICSAVALNGLAMEWAAQANGQGSLQLLWKVLQASQSCFGFPACGTQAAAESHSVDAAQLTCCALSHRLPLAVLCALCSLVSKEMVHLLCVCRVWLRVAQVICPVRYLRAHGKVWVCSFPA